MDERNEGIDSKNDPRGEKTSLVENKMFDSIGIDDIGEYGYFDYLKKMNFPGRFLYAVRQALNMSEASDDKEVREEFRKKVPEGSRLKSSPRTLWNWLKGENFPINKKAREDVFRICYLLGLDIAGTEVFFKRCCLPPFNYRNGNDVAYLFFIRKRETLGKTFEDMCECEFIENLPQSSNEIIEEDDNENPDTVESLNGRSSLKSRVEVLASMDELKDYISKYCNTQRRYTAALNRITDLQIRCLIDLVPFKEVKEMLPGDVKKSLNLPKLLEENEALGYYIYNHKINDEYKTALCDALGSLRNSNPDTEGRTSQQLRRAELSIIDNIYWEKTNEIDDKCDSFKIRRDDKKKTGSESNNTRGKSDPYRWISENLFSKYSDEERKRINSALDYVNHVVPEGNVKDISKKGEEFIRNTLVVLFFAQHFITCKWDKPRLKKEEVWERFGQFVNSINSELAKYDFPQIYTNNPFDFIVLKSAANSEPGFDESSDKMLYDPIGTFRDMIQKIFDPVDDDITPPEEETDGKN